MRNVYIVLILTTILAGQAYASPEVDLTKVRALGQAKIEAAIGAGNVAKEIGFFFQDGAANLNAPVVMDMGALYFVEQLTPGASPGSDIQIAYIVGLDGSEQVQYIKTIDSKIYSFNRSGSAVFKDSASDADIAKLASDLSKKFPGANAQLLKSVRIITFSDSKQLPQLISFLKSSSLLDSVDLDRTTYVLPVEFSKAVPIGLTPNVVDLGSPELRSVYSSLIKIGRKYSTTPSLPPGIQNKVCADSLKKAIDSMSKPN